MEKRNLSILAKGENPMRQQEKQKNEEHWSSMPRGELLPFYLTVSDVNHRAGDVQAKNPGGAGCLATLPRVFFVSQIVKWPKNLNHFGLVLVKLDKFESTLTNMSHF